MEVLKTYYHPTDCGRHWALLTPECVPPAIGCAGYTMSSVYTATQYNRWRRVTVYLPSAAKYVCVVCACVFVHACVCMCILLVCLVAHQSLSL